MYEGIMYRNIINVSNPVFFVIFKADMNKTWHIPIPNPDKNNAPTK